MSILRADSIRDRAGTGAPDFPNGLTGNLTGTATTATALSGTPNITVGTVTGTDATFSGNLTVNGTTTTIDTAVTAVDSLSVDGAGTFGGVVEIGGDANNGTAEGIELNTSGFLQLSRSGNSALLAGYTQGSSTQTIRINNDGSATFAGKVDVNNELHAHRASTTASNALLALHSDIGGTKTRKSTIRADGSAEFAGTVSDSIGPLRRLDIVSSSVDLTLSAALHAGRLIRMTSTNRTFTIPSGSFSSGDMITIFHVGTGNMTIAQGSSVTLYNAADGATGNRTLAAKGMVTIACTDGASNEFVISGSQLT